MSERSAAIYKLAAQLKRARKAAKRLEDARRTAEGRARQWASPWVHWSSYPLGLWDREERFWRCNPPHDCAGFTPRWRQRLSRRRSLPWPENTWLRWSAWGGR